MTTLHRCGGHSFGKDSDVSWPTEAVIFDVISINTRKRLVASDQL